MSEYTPQTHTLGDILLFPSLSVNSLSSLSLSCPCLLCFPLFCLLSYHFLRHFLSHSPVLGSHPLIPVLSAPIIIRSFFPFFVSVCLSCFISRYNCHPLRGFTALCEFITGTKVCVDVCVTVEKSLGFIHLIK